MLRILWYAKDAPFLTSAYAKIADYLVLKRVSKHHKIALFCTVGYDIGCIESKGEGVDVWYPRLVAANGEDVLLQHMKDFNADLFVSASDIWIYEQLPVWAKQGQIIWIPWCYIDYIPTEREADKLSPALMAVPTSKWLQEKLRAVGLENVADPIFLGVDHEIFKPWIGDLDEEKKEITKGRLKASLGFPEDSFLIDMVQMNQTVRKPFEEQFHGIQIFKEQNPDVKVKVYCHSLPRQIPDGYSLPELALEYGMDYQKGDIRFADNYTMICKGVLGYGEQVMAKIYNAADVVLDATTGVSPGMPVLESQSCGVPVIGTEYTCYPEFVHAGYCAKVGKYFRNPTMPWIKKALPDPYSVADCLNRILNSKPEAWRNIGVQAMKPYSWDNCLKGWLDLLKEAEIMIDHKCLKIPTPSEALKTEALILTQ